MMQVLADEYQQRLRVNCINPGGTRTAMRASAFPTEDPQKLKTPADIMPLYLWLMGDDSRRSSHDPLSLSAVMSNFHLSVKHHSVSSE